MGQMSPNVIISYSTLSRLFCHPCMRVLVYVKSSPISSKKLPEVTVPMVRHVPKMGQNEI